MSINHYKEKKVPKSKLAKWTQAKKYKPAKGLIDALNVSLELNMPLILTGEPGTGKTQFAHHIADHFDLGEVLVFNAKTTSIGSELFYRYQAIKHFQYIQNLKNLPSETTTSKSMEDFIEYHALGKAIIRAQEKKKRSVVLIDEIDKAPRDFPNDILNELEYLQFEVPELDRSFEVPEGFHPIIILTSNSEKNLPAPFLRRCIYYNIDFPKTNDLFEIIKTKMMDEKFEEGTLMNLISEFESIRDIAQKNNTKQPATAELITWVAILKQLEFNTDTIGSPKVDEKKLIQSYSVLAKSEVLLKALKTRITSWKTAKNNS